MSQIITSNLTSAGYTLQTQSVDDFIYIAAGVVVSNTSGPAYPAYSAIGVFHDNAHIAVAGSLVSGFTAVIYSLYANNLITVTTTGSILSMGLAWTAVDMRASGAQINNAGEIISASIAVQSSVGDMVVLNTGLISASDIGIQGATRVENDGTIRGVTAVQMSVSDDTLINTGHLIGKVDLGGGGDLFDGRSGTVTGSLLGGAGDDTFLVSQADLAIVELALGGFDTVAASVDFALADQIEVLTLTGTAKIGTGNSIANTLNGNHLSNLLSGLAGDDTLSGGVGADVVYGGAGNDSLLGGDDADTVDGGDGADRVYGESGDDVLRGRVGADRLEGGSDDDKLYGGIANDSLYGGTGDDLLQGGLGTDVFYGGADSDSFVFASVNDSKVGATHDTIADFVAGTDTIDLSLIDAKALTSGNDAFAFIGLAAFTNGTAGQLRYTVSGANIVVQADVNGDAVADFEVQVNGLTAITAAAFLL